MSIQKESKSKGNFENLKKILKARAFYNPELKIISYGISSRGMFNYCCNWAGLDNEKLREISSKTKPICNFPKIQGLFLEKIAGCELPYTKV